MFENQNRMDRRVQASTITLLSTTHLSVSHLNNYWVPHALPLKIDN